MLDELAHALPKAAVRGRGPRPRSEAAVRGIAAGLHATVELPEDYDGQAILDQGRRRGIVLRTMRDFWIPPSAGVPALLIGYAQIPVPAMPTAVPCPCRCRPGDA
ncbi:hypothetical protein [Actinomadura sp. 9N215]|uniref:hypothetical protein n=1 Tax=Actinomadura sp. 9N215 TaxID=3375150 RepID=UPI00379D7BF3